MAVKKRCIRCLKVVRSDGTCQNPKCVLYVPEPPTENGSEATEDNGSGTTTEQP
ncbi:MAG: hypothetical protein IJ712_07460 [Anaerovibrio sp.]|nr:hypothetical protein [Anaerovibrio sp.]